MRIYMAQHAVGTGMHKSEKVFIIGDGKPAMRGRTMKKKSGSEKALSNGTQEHRCLCIIAEEINALSKN